MRYCIIVLVLILAWFIGFKTCQYYYDNNLPDRHELEQTIKAIQTSLSPDYYNGKIDGLYGTETQDALYRRESEQWAIKDYEALTSK
jgi:hypothetical protein